MTSLGHNELIEPMQIWYQSLICWISLRKHKNIFTFSNHFSTLRCHRYWNPSSYNTRTCLSYGVNTIAADALAMQGARASAAMVLTLFFKTIPISAKEQLQDWNFYDKTKSISIQIFYSSNREPGVQELMFYSTPVNSILSSPNYMKQQCELKTFILAQRLRKKC